MESSVLYTFARQYGKPFVSYKIISDHLDVDITEWQRRVQSMNEIFAKFVERIVGDAELI